MPLSAHQASGRSRSILVYRTRLARYPQSEDRATRLGVAGRDRAAVALRGLLHDRQSESRAGQRTRLRRSIEPLEHVRKIGVGDARPLVGDRQGALVEPYLDGPQRRTPLRGVVEQVG